MRNRFFNFDLSIEVVDLSFRLEDLLSTLQHFTVNKLRLLWVISLICREQQHAFRRLLCICGGCEQVSSSKRMAVAGGEE